MSTNFVHLVGLFFGVLCLASLHQVHSMEVLTNATLLDEPKNVTNVNIVNGEQHLSKKHETLAALAEPETDRDPRMTVIENQTVRGNSYYRPGRETPLDAEKTHERRYTHIRFNEVNGNQFTSKKRESLPAMPEPENDRDRRYTDIRFNEVNGHQFTSKRESPVPLLESEPVRNRRFTIIHENDVHGDQIIRGKREAMESKDKDEKTRDRRWTEIRFNEVNGNQFTSKRESPVPLPEPEQARNRRWTEIRFNEVNGNQFTSKRENPAPLTESETVRDPRMTIVNGQLFTKGGRIFPAEREVSDDGEKTRDRRWTDIRFNEVNGNQFTSKRESPLPMPEPEPVRDPRMTIVNGQLFTKGGRIFPAEREVSNDGEKTRDRRWTEIRFNEVNGNQFTSKRESPVPLPESEKVRNRRFTIIHENDVHGDQIIRGKREVTEPKDKDEKTRDRRYTHIRFNEVNGNQYTSKRENPAPLTEGETVRDPRMTVIENQTVRGNSYYRPERETPLDAEKTHERRYTHIRFNEVNGNQYTSKKRETPVVPAESETVRNRRMTIYESPIYYGYPSAYSQIYPNYASAIGSGGNYRLNQALERLQNSAYRMVYSSRLIPNSVSTQYQYASVPSASASASSAQQLSMSGTPNFVGQMTVNGNQFLSKK